MANTFLLLCMPVSFMLNVKHCEFFFIWALEVFHKNSPGLFWEAAELNAKSDSFEPRFYVLLPEIRAVFSLGVIFFSCSEVKPI